MCAQSRFEFALAAEAEDEVLRTLLRNISMPGEMTLSFQREPSFFLGEQAGNRTSQVIVCRDHQKDQIVGMGSRSIRSVYIDGKPTLVGYLSMLRGTAEVHGTIAFARGYRYLHQLHMDGAVPYYFTTILDDNTNARSLLTSGRAGLPVYQPIARLITYLIPLRRKLMRKATIPRIGGQGEPRSDTFHLPSEARGRQGEPKVSRVEQERLPAVVASLQDWNSQYQFAPVYTLSDLLGQSSMLPCFCWENLYRYQENGKIVGTLGVWDQHAFKQTVVTAYSLRMSFVRPCYNLFASLAGHPGLPATGAEVKLLYAACLSGDAAIFEALLHQIRLDWSGKGYDYLSIGICEGSPLSAVASHHATQHIASTAYVVYWPQDAQICLPDMSRPVHLEVATL